MFFSSSENKKFDFLIVIYYQIIFLVEVIFSSTNSFFHKFWRFSKHQSLLDFSFQPFQFMRKKNTRIVHKVIKTLNSIVSVSLFNFMFDSVQFVWMFSAVWTDLYVSYWSARLMVVDELYNWTVFSVQKSLISLRTKTISLNDTKQPFLQLY